MSIHLFVITLLDTSHPYHDCVDYTKDISLCFESFLIVGEKYILLFGKAANSDIFMLYRLVEDDFIRINERKTIVCFHLHVGMTKFLSQNVSNK